MSNGIERPKVLTWFLLYCGVLCFLYAVVGLLGVVVVATGHDRTEMVIYGIVFALLGGVFFLATLLPLFLKPKPWVYTYDLIVICFGLTSACFMPVSIYLLVQWMKPEVKGYFGKQ